MNEIPEALNFTGRGTGVINTGHMLHTVRVILFFSSLCVIKLPKLCLYY